MAKNRSTPASQLVTTAVGEKKQTENLHKQASNMRVDNTVTDGSLLLHFQVAQKNINTEHFADSS